MRIDVHVHQAQAGVASITVDDCGALRQPEWQPLPTVTLPQPTDDCRLTPVPHDQLADLVAIEVSQTHATILSVEARVNRTARVQSGQSL